MHMLQFHAANNAQQERFQEIVEIYKLSDQCFRIKTITNNNRIHYTFVYPFCTWWLDNKPDLLAFEDGKIYSGKDLYNFCSNWITEDILNVLEVPNG